MKDDEVDFDPYLGLGIAESWWLLGRYLSAFHPAESDDVMRATAERWIADLFDDDEPWHEDARAALKADRLVEFAKNAYRLLERKFRGEPIGPEALALVKPAVDYQAREDGQFLDLFEPVDVWWANEYRMLFLDLVEPKTHKSWLHAVGTCANEKCSRFFVKQRSDQRFHSEACRARAANQRAYEKRRAKSHKAH